MDTRTQNPDLSSANSGNFLTTHLIRSTIKQFKQDNADLSLFQHFLQEDKSILGFSVSPELRKRIGEKCGRFERKLEKKSEFYYHLRLFHNWVTSETTPYRSRLEEYYMLACRNFPTATNRDNLISGLNSALEFFNFTKGTNISIFDAIDIVSKGAYPKYSFILGKREV